MRALRRFVIRLTASVLGRRADNRVREELAEHLTLLTEEYVRAGLPLDEARRRARLKLGAGDAVTEAHRDEHRLRPLEDTWQDIRYALRILARVPGFAAAAILSIGLGIGANAAIFGIVNAVMLRTLPYAEPEKLVGIWGTHVRTGGRQFLAPAAFLDVKNQTGTLEQVEAVEYVTFNLVTAAGPLRVAGARASAGIFSLLGIGAVQGRTFLQSEDGFGSSPVAFLSYGLWQRQLGSDPRAIGQSVTLNGVAHTIIGVVPATLQFPLNGPEVWVPFAMSPEERAVRHTSNIQVFGRLKQTASADQVQAELTSIARRQEHEIPQYKEWASSVIPLHEQMVSVVREALLLLLVAAGLVLLVACANVGNLLVARSAARRQEISVRIALGARRSRLVRQLLTESLVLAVGGSILGVALAHSVVQALRGIVPPTVLERSRGDFAIDGSVLMFSLAITLLATVVFGVWPALRLSSAESNPSLGAARRLTGTQRDRRLRATLVVLETALSLVLLVGAGLLINSFWRLQRVDPGFRADRLLTFRIALPESEYRDKLVPVGDVFVWEGRQVPQFFDELLQRLGALPGVTGVAALGYAPLTGENNSATFEKELARSPEGVVPTAFFRPVSANYFRTLGIPLLRGRELNERDIQGASPVAVISETMARQYWRGEDPLGQRFRTSLQMPWRTIVGVVGDVRYQGLSEPTVPEMYFAYGQALTQELFDQVQRRLNGNPTTGIGRRKGQQDFPLRRFVRCARCGKPVTGGWARGRWGNRYAYYYCRQRCSGVITRKATLEEKFVELLRQLVPSPEWLELLKQTILSIWHEELGQVSDVRESVQMRVTQIRAKLRRLDEAFLHESSVDRITYEEHRDRLREELTLAELELSDARLEQFDIDSALAKAISVLNNASALWADATLEDRMRLQEVLFPQGLVWDGVGFQTPVTCLSFYHLAPIEGSGRAPHPIDGVQTPPISLASNELGGESRAEVNVGTGTGISHPL